MLSKGFFSMLVTVLVAVATYYFLSTNTLLSENMSITAGVVAAMACSLVLKKFTHRQR